MLTQLSRNGKHAAYKVLTLMWQIEICYRLNREFQGKEILQITLIKAQEVLKSLTPSIHISLPLIDNDIHDGGDAICYTYTPTT